MIGLVLVAHGRLAAEFRAALEHVVGPQSQIETVSIGPDDDIERRRQDIVDAVARVDDGSGVVVLTDMFGGTPSNLAISVMAAGKVEVIAGVNLPMLIKLASVRGEGRLSDVDRRSPGSRAQVHQRGEPGADRQVMAAVPRVPLVRDLVIANKRGLHARAAARFVQCAERFDATVTVSKDQTTVDGTSIMGLMMLAAVPGSVIRVTAEGTEAEAVLTALVDLVAGRFGEDE